MFSEYNEDMSENATVDTPPEAAAPGAAPPSRPRWPRAALIAPLAISAVLGGAVAAATVVAVDGGKETRTIVRTQAAPVSAAAAVTQTAAPTSVSRLSGLSVNAIYREAAPGVVRVTQGDGQGSGFVIDNQGYILTNQHVVGNGSTATVSFSNNDKVDAKVVGTDASTDVALLRVDGLPSSALRPIPLGSSKAIQVGDPVVAIGNPFGLDRTVTSGIVSAVGREIQSPNGYPIDGAIQTDAAINHGNSGGPLLNGNGEVIGIASQIADSGVNGNVGIGFAVPIDLVKQILQDLKTSGHVDHAWLGVRIADVDATLAASVRLPVRQGAMIAEVVPGGPAANAGLKGASHNVVLQGTTYADGGDIVTRVGDTQITSSRDLFNAISGRRSGDHVDLTVVGADGKTRHVSVQLGKQPTNAATLQDQPQDQSPFDVPSPSSP